MYYAPKYKCCDDLYGDIVTCFSRTDTDGSNNVNNGSVQTVSGGEAILVNHQCRWVLELAKQNETAITVVFNYICKCFPAIIRQNIKNINQGLLNQM